MSDHHDQPFEGVSPSVDPQASEPQPERNAEGRTRRRLFQAALAAVPVVLTLRARPAHAHVVRVSPDRDPDFYLSGHGLSKADEVHETGSPDQSTSTSWLEHDEPSSGWSEGSSWSSDDAGGGGEMALE